MRISNSIGWYFERNIYADVDRDLGGGVYSGVVAGVEIEIDEEIQL